VFSLGFGRPSSWPLSAWSPERSAALPAALISLLLLIFSSVAIIQFEDVPEQRQGAGRCPVVGLRPHDHGGIRGLVPSDHRGPFCRRPAESAGVGLFGTLSGFVAAWFLTPDREKQEDEFEQLRTALWRPCEAVERKG